MQTDDNLSIKNNNLDVNQQVFVPFSVNRVQKYQSKGYWESENHIEFLYQIQQKFADNTAIVDGSKKLSYRELYENSQRFAAYLISQGIKKDDFIILQSGNHIEFFVVLFAIYYIAARPVFCLHGHGAYEIESISKKSGAVGYIKIASPSEKIDAMDVTNQFSMPNFCLWYRETIYPQMLVSESFKEFAHYDLPLPDRSNVSSREIAFLQLSGGTTGSPKLIPRTHADYLYSVRMSAKVAGLNMNSKQLIVLPVMHNFPMSSPGFLGVMSVGAAVVLASEPTPKQCFQLIQKHQVTQVSLVPSLVSLWLNSPLLNKYNLSSLTVIQVGGAKFLPKLAEQLMNTLNIKLQQVYGMAEGLVCFTRLDDTKDAIVNTQGKPLSEDDQIRIIDDSGAVLGVNQVGQITTKGPYTINGYYNAALINARSFDQDGFYHTGDLGYIDNNGCIIVTGRQKEQINRAGEKIVPSELENLIITHPVVKDVYVTGVADIMLGEKIKVFLILRSNENSITLKEIRKFLMKQRIANFKLPDEVEVVDDFHYTLVGKVRK